MKILLVAGARPNFMKIAPILRAIDDFNIKNSSKIESVLVHTGQHYDSNMSETFFNDFGIKEPDFNLTVGSGTHAEQTAGIMLKLEKICFDENPDFVLVVGDVNSTIAAGIVAKKLKIKLIHVEAGLRSFDREMPEEINRVLTDAITDIFFTTEEEGVKNLLKEGQSEQHIYLVGNIMIDNLYYQLSKELKANEFIVQIKKGLSNKKYLSMTLHRPSNIDDKLIFKKLLSSIRDISIKYDLVTLFVCHPRARAQIELMSLQYLFKDLPTRNITNNIHFEPGIYLLEPMGYNDFLCIWKDSIALLTDSGGLQEETTALGIPCLTLRNNTERPITCSIGTNTLVGNDLGLIEKNISNILNNNYKKGSIPPLWDGKSAVKMVEIIYNYYKNSRK